MDPGPIRTCCGCRTRRPQQEFLRVARLPDGGAGLDPQGRRGPGRGAYVCPERDCIDRALSGGLRRALRTVGRLPDGLRAELLARAGLETE